MFKGFIILLLYSFTFINAKFLYNLDRTFSTGDDKVLDVSIDMSNDDYQKVLESVQVSKEDHYAKTVNNVKIKVNVTISDNSDSKFFPESILKIGGNYARSFSKPGFNIKLPTLYNNRKSFRLRTDVNDKSHIRQKVVIDTINRAGLPSVQSTYVTLTVNGNYYGLYTLMDTLKPVNLKKLYNTKAKKDELQVIQCKTKGFILNAETAELCVNDNSDDETDLTEFKKFLSEVDDAETIEDLDKIMNVDIFLKYFALDWLIGSTDHFLLKGKNLYFYKSEINNKWDILYYDFDNTLGQGNSIKGLNTPFKHNNKGQRIIDIAVIRDDTRFKKNLKELLTYGYNPDLLFPHIDDIKKLIDPYIKKEYIPIDGQLPGRVNHKGFPMKSSYEEYQMASEFTPTNYTEVEGTTSIFPSVKFWIQQSFEFACDQYKFDKEEILNDAVTLTPKSFFTKIKKGESPYDDDSSVAEEPVEDECWSEQFGYSCCKECNVILSKDNQKWGVEDGKWCGIKSFCNQQENFCSKSEYPCCETCNQYYYDNTGRYGYENSTWCLLKNNCH